MEEYYENQPTKLSAIVNQKFPTRVVRGTDRLTETSLKTISRIQEARLLYNQATTAGGWNILRHEIANFLARN